MRRIVLVTAAVIGLLSMLVPAADAVHFYRGPAGGCTPKDGALGAPVAAAATVMMGHNSYNDPATALLPVTVVEAGDAVTWTWNSAHCHSVTGAAFDSGYFYPASEPTTPPVAPGVFHYPILETEPTLSFTKVFATPGTYSYSCVHHAAIGMAGVVVVQ